MKIEIQIDGSAYLYAETGQIIGHFANDKDAKAFAKETYGKEGVVKKSDVSHQGDHEDVKPQK